MKRLKSISPVNALRLIAVALVSLMLALPASADKMSETQQRLLEDIKYLASDDLEGRGVGTKGIDLAAEYVRDQFARAGLDVTRMGGGAFQTFTMATGSKLGKENALVFLGPDGREIELTLNEDVSVCSFGDSGEFDAPLVFAGYAIESDEPTYNDFADVDVEGKVVVIMRRTPRQGAPHGGPFGSPHGGTSRHAALTTKLSNAFRRGAAAVLFVNDPYTIRKNAERKDSKKAEVDPLMKFGYGGAAAKGKTIPVLHITADAADKLLKSGLGKSLEELEAAIDKDLKPQSAVVSGRTARGVTSVERTESEVKNVIAVLEGDGPLADETVVIGAHYDHVGLGTMGGSLAPGVKAVHNGADDNASGTAVLLEVARRLAAREEKLPRRVVFIAFTAEEVGLVGSAYYVKKPVFPLEKTVAMFNMDMVGRLRDDKLTVFGTGTAKEFKPLIENLGKQHDFKVTFKPEGFGPSDHSSFYAKKIPVLHFFTNTHGDYHRPSDDWEKVNIPGTARIVDVIEEALVATATATERPQYVEIKRRATLERSGSRPYFGSIPDFATDTPGYAISGVAGGSPADQAGLKGSDVIVQLGKQKIGSLEDFDLALRKFKPGQEAEVTVLRGGKRMTFKVKLAEPK